MLENQASKVKQMGRPVTRPTARRVIFNLEEEFIGKIIENAKKKTKGNRSILLEKILSGELSLD